MARSNASSRSIATPDPSQQASFHGLLAAARQTVLKDALLDALAEVDPDEVKRELSKFVPRDAQKILARAGIRDEEVFPTPVVLKTKPTLVGYYRLLLGVSQKRFYASATGMGPLKALEERGILKPRQEAMLPDFCKAMCEALAELVREVSPGMTQRDIDELPLLTLGAQFQGSNNNAIGQLAIREVFLAIKEIVKDHIEKEGTALLVRNASGRLVRITQAADPDVRIEEEFGSEWRRTTAIEIKGGTDRSNAHNRAGEAEKSHQKAKATGFRDFWTIIAKQGLDIAVLQSESPTTNSWFDAAQVLARQGTDWAEFASRLAGAVGIPYS